MPNSDERRAAAFPSGRDPCGWLDLGRLWAGRWGGNLPPCASAGWGLCTQISFIHVDYPLFYPYARIHTFGCENSDSVRGSASSIVFVVFWYFFAIWAWPTIRIRVEHLFANITSQWGARDSLVSLFCFALKHVTAQWSLSFSYSGVCPHAAPMPRLSFAGSFS